MTTVKIERVVVVVVWWWWLMHGHVKRYHFYTVNAKQTAAKTRTIGAAINLRLKADE